MLRKNKSYLIVRATQQIFHKSHGELNAPQVERVNNCATEITKKSQKLKKLKLKAFFVETTSRNCVKIYPKRSLVESVKKLAVKRDYKR